MHPFRAKPDEWRSGRRYPPQVVPCRSRQVFAACDMSPLPRECSPERKSGDAPPTIVMSPVDVGGYKEPSQAPYFGLNILLGESTQEQPSGPALVTAAGELGGTLAHMGRPPARHGGWSRGRVLTVDAPGGILAPAASSADSRQAHGVVSLQGPAGTPPCPCSAAPV